MKTPREYTKSLKNGIITKTMLSDCLYSVNKRAKNYRDRVREERDYQRRCHYRCMYDNTESLFEKEQGYYHMKEQMLAYLTPTCIHREMQDHRIRISSCDFDSWKAYRKQYDKDLKNNRIVYENSYLDYLTDEEVEFYNVIETEPAYYLFYDLETEHTFHTPITEEQAKQHEEQDGLAIVDLDGPLITYGDDIDDLVSVQFVRKVIAALTDGAAHVVADASEPEGTQSDCRTPETSDEQ